MVLMQGKNWTWFLLVAGYSSPTTFLFMVSEKQLWMEEVDYETSMVKKTKQKRIQEHKSLVLLDAHFNVG